MSVSYNVFTNAFLQKIEEFELLRMDDWQRDTTVDSLMRRAFAAFQPVCKYDFATTGDDISREFAVDVPEYEAYEIEDIISEGMVAYWMKSYVNRQELLENILNTNDFSQYSPANLLSQVRSTQESTERRFVNMIREYSYRHGDLKSLHI